MIPLHVICRYHFAKVIQDSKKGIKDFTALQDYYVHLQMRTIETFPVDLAKWRNC